MEPDFRLTNAEGKLVELLWTHAPIASMELVSMALQEFGWKKSTTFTNLKSLIKKGIVTNEKATVNILYSREDISEIRSCMYVDESFGGSLPLFIAAFTRRRKLSSGQVEELKKLIDEVDLD